MVAPAQIHGVSMPSPKGTICTDVWHGGQAQANLEAYAGSTQRWSLQAFDYETGRPKRYVEMLSWPRAHRLHRALPTVLAGVFWESFVPTKAAATMRMVLNRFVLQLFLLDVMLL